MVSDFTSVANQIQVFERSMDGLNWNLHTNLWHHISSTCHFNDDEIHSLSSKVIRRPMTLFMYEIKDVIKNVLFN